MYFGQNSIKGQKIAPYFTCYTLLGKIKSSKMKNTLMILQNNPSCFNSLIEDRALSLVAQKYLESGCLLFKGAFVLSG